MKNRINNNQHKTLFYIEEIFVSNTYIPKHVLKEKNGSLFASF
jgi:hypothetical protein